MSDNLSISDKMNAALEAVNAEFPNELPAEAPHAEAKTDAPVEAKTDEKATEAPTAEVSAAPSTPAQRSKDYEDWLTKWGGPDRDPDVAARASWDMNNRLAETARTATETPAPTAKEPEPVVVPEVKRFDDELRALEKSYSKLDETFKAKVQERNSVQEKIEELVETITSLDLDVDTDVAKRKELAKARAQFARLSQELNGITAEANALAKDHANTKILRDQEVRLRKFEEAREAEITERTRQREDLAIQTFANTFYQELEKATKDGIPADLIPDFKQFAKDRSHIKLNVEDLPTTDVPAFIGQAKKDYLLSVDRSHRTLAKVYAERKTKDAEVQAPGGAAAVATTQKKRGFRSQQEVEDFIAANV